MFYVESSSFVTIENGVYIDFLFMGGAMDPGTGLTVLGSAIGGGAVVEKILGPTAEYVGVGLKSWSEKRVQNVVRIFGKAAEKLGDKIEKPGSIPPRVLKEVLDEGSYCDDELTTEYFGGVLASARSDVSRDDRAAPFLKLTSELSSYQIRSHFILYRSWREVFKGSELRTTFEDDIQKMEMFIPFSLWDLGMDIAQNEPAEDILFHCLTGLERHKLSKHSHWGKIEHINALNKSRGWREVDEPGICIHPTTFGMDYWLWAIGSGSTNYGYFLDPNLDLPELPDISFPTNPLPLVPDEK